MHIPDGYLSPQTYGPLWAIMLFIWQRASVIVKRTINKKNLPLIALSAAFCFVIQMFNVPILGGSTGHAVGSAVVAIALGPWAAAIAISTTVIIQAVLFSDGGITAIGANSFTMAFVMPFSAYYVYRLLAGKYERFGLRQKISAAIAGYVSLNVSAIVTAIIIGLQPIIAVSANGQPLYAPYPLKVAIPAIAMQNMLFFGFLEAAVTGFVCAYLARANVFQIAKTAQNFSNNMLNHKQKNPQSVIASDPDLTSGERGNLINRDRHVVRSHEMGGTPRDDDESIVQKIAERSSDET